MPAGSLYSREREHTSQSVTQREGWSMHNTKDSYCVLLKTRLPVYGLQQCSSYHFSLNAAQDTLPHNANLALWRRSDGLSDACKLCGMRQTLPHVLNQCPVSLHLRRYNTRHDAVLEVIESGIKPLLSDGECLLTDLQSDQPYIFAPHIAHTDLRPDIVLRNTSNRFVCLVELTICYETRYEEAHTLKENKDADLVEEIREAGVYSPELITLEVGSRGPFHHAGFDDLKNYLCAPSRAWEAMFVQITKTVI